MEYSTLGSSNLSVSRICLGSMTWGKQNNQEDANQQIDYALSQGINFIDTAEMYAVPPSPDTYGKTETIIGNWLAANPERRKEIILASKIAGPGLPWVREGSPITGEAVIAAVDASLARLQTDYIDLYQLHWPNRTSPHFGKHFPNQFKFSNFDAKKEEADMLEILQALDTCIKAGKIRHIGLSDDTPWGINTYLKLSAKYDLPKMVSIQNEFSLLHAKDWPYLIENCVHEDIAYLPWSPLAGGMLSGKYLDGKMPEGSRWTFSQRNGIFRDTPAANEAVRAYMQVAEKHGYTPCQLALAWCDQVDGVTSTIIGATSLEQLKEDIDAFSKPLSDEAISDINLVFKKYPMPF
ncbi:MULTISPECIES: aldo/keto reductase [Aliivibrio]|uniref:Aldo/keto reductase n=1 Tax=Aliivibrio finisterrensis TaxID=511998 RepID=A0A4Q5L225_9GAMM|nr:MULTISPECIES: aldo/keto reductase [Aliivibrio]MDD9177223.1 aldo/keto reductase [Aliivibrio sp. A6]RYU51844.1 aldo/keto reductase [Aliivibrio finisterrensis]RYU54714.1 aldo/keto reductase [Aliivibrio finisterrensis]RYU57646.1 aldo/keto reductase [Aliivibrio finisterrensis]RYU66903.1 aldo/keto reductase [Aliivibrio finisterrensis]